MEKPNTRKIVILGELMNASASRLIPDEKERVYVDQDADMKGNLRLWAPFIVDAIFDKHGNLTVNTNIMVPSNKGDSASFKERVDCYVNFNYDSSGVDSEGSRNKPFELFIYCVLKEGKSPRRGNAYRMFPIQFVFRKGVKICENAPDIRLKDIKSISVITVGENPRTSRGTTTTVQSSTGGG